MINCNQMIHIPVELRITSYPSSYHFYDFILAHLIKNVSEDLNSIFDSEMQFRYQFDQRETVISKVFDYFGMDNQKYLTVARAV